MKFIKQFVIVTVIIVLSLCGNTKATYAQVSTDLSFLDEFIQDYMKEHHIPNASIAIVSNEEVIFEEGYGYANMEEDIAVNPNLSLFRIGSVSKLFTWTAVMQLVEQGKLDLDTDVNEYIDFDIPDQLANNQTNTNSKPITLRHLMTHTPGFEDYSSAIFRLDESKMWPLHEYVRELLPKRIFPAGEITAYSNYGTALAGYIVENVSGIPFPDYVDQHIFKPLHMSQSTFEQPLPSNLSSNMAQAYRYIDNQYKTGAFEFMPSPAGGMSTTASDMAQFMNAYLNDGTNGEQQILTAETIEQMFTKQTSHHPALDGMALGFMERTTNNKRVLHHGGSTMLFDSGLYLLPEENIGMFIGYSGADFQFHLNVLQQFMDEFFPADEKETDLSPVGTDEQSKQYVGEYHQNRKSFTTDEKLTSLMMGTIRVELDQEGDLAITHNGISNRFVETSEGMYQNISKEEISDAYGAFQTIVFKTDADKNIILMTDGPMTYSKAPWYESTSFTFASLAISLLLMIGTTIYWAITSLFRTVRKRPKQETFLRIAKWAVISYGISLIVIVAGVIASGEIDPVYVLPKDAYGLVPEWVKITDLFFLLILFAGPFIILFTVISWVKNLWHMRNKIHFSLLSSAIILLTWIFLHWNLI